MDDSKSDNTDDLLTSIEPLLQQSEYFMNQRDYKNKDWVQNVEIIDVKSNIPVIVDDILSSRTAKNDDMRQIGLYESPSIANMVSHNSRQDLGLESGRTVSSHFYEASISSQSTPRNMTFNKYHPTVMDGYISSQSRKQNDSMEYMKNTREIQLQDKLEEALMQLNQSRTEIQRLQLNNKQMSTQLHEAKLSIQTLSIQLEQVQQESKHKESTLSNLDNTLGKLVSGWKKRESEKEQDLDSLRQQVEAKDKVIDECQRITEESRRALLNADKAVQMEKNKMEQLLKNTGVEIQNLKNEKSILSRSNTELNNRCSNMEIDIKKLNGIISEKTKCNEALSNQIKEQYASWKKENDNLKKDIDRLQQEVLQMQFEVHSRDDKVSQMKNEMNKLEEESHRCRMERDEKIKNVCELKNSIKKMQDDNISGLKKQEKEISNQWQQNLNKTILDIQDQNKRSAQIQYNNYQSKLNEQSKRHRLELERLRHVAEQEIMSRVSDSQETVSMLRERLERSEKSVQFWQQEKEVVEKARNQISSKLWEFMKSGYKDGSEKNSNVSELVKPTFVPPKNQSLQQTMPNSFFEPIKMDFLMPDKSPKSKKRMDDYLHLSDKGQVILSSSNASLYY